MEGNAKILGVQVAGGFTDNKRQKKGIDSFKQVFASDYEHNGIDKREKLSCIVKISLTMKYK
jgi:hypothetical protein